MSKMPAKKKSCFQITSVIQAQVGSGAGVDDAESLDDPDESRTEDASSEIFDVSRADFEPDACDQSWCEEAANSAGQGQQPPGAPAGPGPQPVGCSSRFRVIKLDHGTGEPFRRGRWMCAEFYDKEPEASTIAGRTSDGVRHAGEHLADRDSGLGVSVVPQAGSDATVAVLDPASQHHPFDPANEVNKAVPAQPLAPPHTLLTTGHGGMNQASLLQKSPVTPQLYPNRAPPNAQLPMSHHMPNRTAMLPAPNLDFHAQHLSLPLKVPGELNVSMSAGQSAHPPNLMEWAGVMASLAPASVLQYSGLAVAAQNLPASGVGGVPAPDVGRRKSDAAAAAAPEEAGLVSNPVVNSLFGIAIPIDGDEDSASGASMVAIDNKIEQAMDLVKSHLMYAVREEVEVLKEQIKELYERNSVLERENAVLKSLANSEQLSQLSSHAAPGAAPGATPAPNPPQPSVSSA
ncbi:TSC22 domain family protein 2 isoform X2 [Trichomycterus rosablanca]|uniref:TSC22 domain family protein 2 isoform X2 n=1 Tax=Trichomycterus rosablanca TaxID=2290929 RepID=UPI002F35DB76